MFSPCSKSWFSVFALLVISPFLWNLDISPFSSSDIAEQSLLCLIHGGLSSFIRRCFSVSQRWSQFHIPGRPYILTILCEAPAWRRTISRSNLRVITPWPLVLTVDSVRPHNQNKNQVKGRTISQVIQESKPQQQGRKYPIITCNELSHPSSHCFLLTIQWGGYCSHGAVKMEKSTFCQASRITLDGGAGLGGKWRPTRSGSSAFSYLPDSFLAFPISQGESFKST